ncbi:hypothetical protein [Pseudoduganella violaceinigra]|uniref:hypothetical protein n=1 Tax=Pseudoduganella violaceinigra TaxID=246602 RepID=UPI000415DC26|nr:hypothetical protein [Pseudoduganella violaceinigra]
MSKPTHGSEKQITIQVSTGERPDFKQPLAAYVYDKRGQEAKRIEIRDGRFELTTGGMDHPRVLIAPINERIDAARPDADRLKRLGAYEPVLQPGRDVITRIDVPGSIIDWWPFCFCWVHGKVVRKSDNRAVCNARVHICEVDRIPLWLIKLPDVDIHRLRDDLIKVLERPRIPAFGPGPGLRRAALRFDPQPDAAALQDMPEDFARKLRGKSTELLRNALVENWKLLLPWFCYWPHWWWLFRCDEMTVVNTDAHGNFEATLFYRCGGDHPDLYFWVEYDFGSGYEVIYRPSKACHTYWDYQCGSEVTIRITDPRVPGCDEEPDLPGCQVVVLSIGNGIAVRQVQSSGTEGLTNTGRPFGGTLEPRVDFSRTELIYSKGVPYYRWSYRRLSGPDGVSGVVAPGSEPLLAMPKAMAADVYRHYKSGTGYSSDLMGPMPTTGPSPAPQPNLFRIRPPVSPSGDEWIVLNEHVDLATAYFQTDGLAGTPGGIPLSDDMAAGRYEMQLELFDAAGVPVNWTAKGIDLRITDEDAPFGIGTVPTVPAPAYNRILSPGGDTMGFRMVVRVDNNRCQAEVHPVGGTVSPDPLCGFHNYSSPSDTATLSFTARHPNNFATYSFGTARGAGPDLPVASTSGTVGDAGGNGFVPAGAFQYAKPVVVSSLLEECPNAAFSELLYVSATATNGYGELDSYDQGDHAAFALAMPCPVCH